MHRVIEKPNAQYASAVFTKPGINILSTNLTSEDDIEILTVEVHSCTVTSMYKPPNTDFSFKEPDNFQSQLTKLVMSDFNCHRIPIKMKKKKKKKKNPLENWAEQMGLKLIRDPRLQPSFNSGRWLHGYNPDNIFVKPLPCTQHRAIICAVEAAVKTETVQFKSRFNFKRAWWEQFTTYLDEEIINTDPTPEKYDLFVRTVQTISHRYIPRGYRTNYVPGLDRALKSLLEKYEQLFEEDPFSNDTIKTGENLLHAVSSSRREE
ncbi:hypothetical protein PR048_002273 [Dryococelus australis]|uniref:Uncharacterized protein n=1 Tax=Dryococelus australis TaxID=614101 RepID=A0ABQ9IJQ9_9NEOP|nr:hypothetical protein PR048_002273 [Dryococelus australis]